ncbi:MAG: PEP/pyruvate-binding domain-containing protein [Bacteroidota bacterium]
MMKGKTFTIVLLFTICHFCTAQNIPILNYSINNFGQVQLEIAAQADQYYLLTAQHQPNFNFESITSITMGVDGNLLISEPLAAFPLQNYQITAHSIANPDDTDGDGVDDITEYNNMPTQAPLNFGNPVALIDGATSIDNYATFSDLAVIEDDIPWAPFLNNQQFVKFAILNQDTDKAEVYYINSKTHAIHASFLGIINTTGADVVTGEIVFNPNEILPNGAIGSYTFNYSFGNAYPFEHTRRTFELLAASMPYLQNNLRHFIGDNGESVYQNTYQSAYEGSRLEVVLESELFADVDFLPFNQTESFGFFRAMALDENPGSRDIVLYDALPNSLPRVGGIITSVIQTPLSHVNLRAIQDNVPNAYIKNPLEIDSIANLLGKYVYYKVEQDRYTIREASLDEVNAWYENLRPTEEQIPLRNLSQTSILPLDSIEFSMSDAFGAKCSNVATMRKFGFPEGTIPNGFGIPFYFYDEFMKYNNFYEEVEDMISDPDFINDLETRIDMLKDFRKEIKEADMPPWMLNKLQVMHDAFPAGTSVRCRSSTNNEDLPGFSGAGLYTSKTQHPIEGHISKSIKQVYASMWNFRAFDERDFYRVDHFVAAMGVLCHPNFEDEKSNGVGVSIDPIYQTENTFYLNTQVGESLITNPDANTIPEEILLNTDPSEGYTVLRESNLVPTGELVMGESYLNLMRDYLKVIHDEFAILYDVVGAEGFGMDIEYKVTSEDQLVIKQARPWVSFWANIKANFDLAVVELINPQSSSSLGDTEIITVKIANQGLKKMSNFELSLLIDGQLIETLSIDEELAPQTSAEYPFTQTQDFSAIGDYDISIVVAHQNDGYEANDTLNTVLSKLHFLEGGIVIEKVEAKCGDDVEVTAKISNYGEATFFDTAVEVLANGAAVDTIIHNFAIPYLAEVEITLSITENLQSIDNEITLNLLSVNGQTDAISDNNTAVYISDLESSHDEVTFIINADNFPQETSWQLYDEIDNELIASGNLNNGDDGLNETICVDYNSCLKLSVFDSYGDGICCSYGMGYFLLVSAGGDTLVYNDGDFGGEAEAIFCPNGIGCAFTTEITTSNASNQNALDGSITINATGGISPFQYSIDGGQSFSTNGSFFNLAAGEYQVVIADASGTCTNEKTVIVDFEIASSIGTITAEPVKVFPNPTEDQLTIAMEEDTYLFGSLRIEIYDALGRLIHEELIFSSGSDTKAIISMKNYPSGTYMIKCINPNFEQHLKVVKW